jgi:hypothetical protein
MCEIKTIKDLQMEFKRCARVATENGLLLNQGIAMGIRMSIELLRPDLLEDFS